MTLSEPARPTPGLPRAVTLVRADNPGPMTLDGTNTYVLRTPGAAGCVVVDPGPDDAAHLDAVAHVVLEGCVAVLLTHRHADHSAGAATLAERLGVPVRAALPDLCSPGATPLADGEVLAVDGLQVVVVATPGHTSDSVCLVLPDDGAVLTGDTVLGAGSTVLMERDGGDLGDYLASLDVLERLAGRAREDVSVVGLPGHGPVVPDLGERVRAYREHRLARLGEVRSVIDTAGLVADPADPACVEAVVTAVYPDVSGRLRQAAEQSARVQLAYLASR
ncbi:MBL fold metallo-hydrolase [Luteimicrobium subarcticum]|uniref:Glyoxylase-like metal-dependent hydrolase (Beta-lactamase superfamily II) n=1 Tax=Luteimicrobium subarcticum TaxID=620910 RepID=A0A2M8WSH4_9MICO|nr:MBL fold metallo-hydrolase [Luteimicrobium subarcticum]PJI93786.1 glyoxylase-like metal-dependent hydrolase (beta-lactamase superfamily II) [Luteimicrobium subarcticum]